MIGWVKAWSCGTVSSILQKLAIKLKNAVVPCQSQRHAAQVPSRAPPTDLEHRSLGYSRPLRVHLERVELDKDLGTVLGHGLVDLWLKDVD